MKFQKFLKIIFDDVEANKNNSLSMTEVIFRQSLKHLCWSLFLIKLPQTFRPKTLFKKRPQNTDVFL